jgi:chromosome segregation ATPase
LQNRLNVIVTETSEKGKELEKRNPNQPFMLLDLIKDSTLTLEHAVLRGQGNPVYAQSLLKYDPDKPSACITKVFNKILGNTIIMDDLSTATEFMKNYNRTSRFQCPTS